MQSTNPSRTSGAASPSQLSKGAVFHKCALQVNPHGYSEAYKGQPLSGSAESHAVEMVKKAIELGISVLAITNHDCVSDIPTFRNAAASSNVTIFPGFEIETKDGIHVLCIYDPLIPDEDLKTNLNVLDITKSENGSSLSNFDFENVVNKVAAQGGITIAAHITEQKGLLHALQHTARSRAWKTSKLLAVQIRGDISDQEPGIQQILRNKNQAYARKHAASEDLAVAVINANDVVKPEYLEHPHATCRIKMSEISIEGLRQAFLDPGSRIRLNSESDQTEVRFPELSSLSWQGGFLDGLTISFNSNLNVLLGGRGAGKSTVIESIRYVMGLEPVGDEAKRTHYGMVKKVLRRGTKITLTVQQHRPTEILYRIERTIGDSPRVRDETGQEVAQTPADLLSQLEIYGQHEIGEIARSPEKLTSLLRRFVERRAEVRERKKEVGGALELNRKSLLATRTQRQRIDHRLATMPSLTEKLNQYQKAGLAERLKDQDYVIKEEGLLRSIPGRLEPFREAIRILRSELPIDQTFLSARALTELPRRKIIGRASPILERLNTALLDGVDGIESALRQAEEELSQIRSDWDAKTKDLEADFQRRLRELGRKAIDADAFLNLTREIETLRPLEREHELLKAKETEELAKRQTLLSEWQVIAQEEFKLLRKAAKKVTRELPGRLRIRVTPGGNRQPLNNLLRERVQGRLSEALETLESLPKLSARDFAQDCRQGRETIKKKYGITEHQARSLAELSEETVMEIEELDLPPTTTIQLNTARSGEKESWHTLEELSTGQKATAILLLLLLESDAPLIVDQPEDDLDNHFITESVVPRIREAKQKRQFLFSTHNANIPVLGDAELIVGLTPGSDHARIKSEHAGSIDMQAIRSLIEDLLEGGKSAFETRRRKYGF